ncbi:MAG: succinyldiaminopimelate transaminase [Acidimicrobiia bacterium]
MSERAGFVPPPYPHDRLAELKARAELAPGGLVDVSVGTPVDPLPDVAAAAMAEATSRATGYPPTIGTPTLRAAASNWMARRFGVRIGPESVMACIGTKELVASLPRLLALRDPSRDTVLYPAVSYPTYAMGAQLAGLRPVPVPLDDEWHLDLGAVADEDAERALVLWVNEPGNPTGSSASPEHLEAVAAWARPRGVLVAADECYVEFTYDDTGAPSSPATILAAGLHGVLAVQSLSKRSNMAGLRAGFVAGDTDLVGYLGECRKHGGLMVPAPVQAAAAAALDDDLHVESQRRRYAARRAAVMPAMEARGLVHAGGASTFYLWLRRDGSRSDGWDIAAELAETGLLVAPGDFYGPDGVPYARVALTVTDDRLAVALERVAETPVSR